MLTLLLASVALAGDPALRACTTAAKVDAPAHVAIVGAETRPTVDGQVGLWLLTCDQGAAFFPHARTPDLTLLPGDVADASGEALACFVRACDLPSGLCLRADADGAWRAVSCTTGKPASAELLSGAPSTSTATAVMVVASVVPPTTAPPTPARPAPAPAMTSTWTPPPAGPVTPPATVDPALWTVPPAPPEPCVTPASLRDASNEQVSLGDEARVGGDLALALGHYRAALQVSACNAFAWTALGATLGEHGFASRAVDALRIAVRLAPTSLPAWSALAAAHETLGRRDEAADAWMQAATLRPGYPPAEAGLRRLGRLP